VPSGNLLRQVAPWGPDRRRPDPFRAFPDYGSLFEEGEFIDDCQGPCECRCKVQWRSAMTQYHWDGKGDDPNHPVLLCEDCAKEYHDYWQEMWDDYNASRL